MCVCPHHHDQLTNLSSLPSYLEHADLSHGDSPNEGIILTLEKLLDGHNLTRLPMPAFEYHSIRSSTDLAQLFVFLHTRHSRVIQSGR